MCSAPKPKKIEEKKPAYLRNPYLDGLSIGGVGGIREGRNALRVDLATPGAAPNYLGVPSKRQPAAPSVGAFPVFGAGYQDVWATSSGLNPLRIK